MAEMHEQHQQNEAFRDEVMRMRLPQADRSADRDPADPARSSTAEAEADAADQPAPLRERVIEALQQVYDPEIPINIYELGLIYEVEISDDGSSVKVIMTLTTPNCPEAQSLPQMVQDQVEAIDEVEHCHVQIVWEPMWHKDMMSDAAKLQLGLI
jgi:FeS assembly SUF system protein